MRSPRPRLRRTSLVLLVALLAVLVAAGWLLWTAQQARHDLQDARASLSEVRAALADGDQARAQQALKQAQTSADSAHDRTDGPVWAAAAGLPVAGSLPESSRGLAAAADGVVAGPLSTLVEVAGSANPRQLWSGGSRVSVDRLASAAPPLTEAADQMATYRDQVAALPADTLVDEVDQARADFLDQLTTLHGTVAGVARTARVGPDLLGKDGPRRYLLVFQNPAEARGTGGILGAYGVLEARRGKLSVPRLGSNEDLDSFDKPVVEPPEEFRRLYNGFGATRFWQQANPSPHFPDAARIWLAMWEQRTGERLDGVIATDPVALGYLLKATGPVRLPGGQRVTASNVVRLTLHDVYARFAEDNQARKAYLQRIARAVVDKALSGGGNGEKLFGQLARASGERRLLVYTTRSETEKDLAGSPVGGWLPSGSGPFAELVVNDIAASKLNYYLDRRFTYAARGDCGAETRRTRVRVSLTNDAPKQGLPDYVVGDVGEEKPGLPRGTDRLLVSVFLADDAAVDEVRVDGEKVLAGAGRERGHPVVIQTLELRPGQTRHLTIDVTEPTSAVSARVPVQPLVRPQQTRVDVPAC